MKDIINKAIIKINCPGGIVSPGLLTILCTILKSIDIAHVKFGLRQNIFIHVHRSLLPLFITKMESSGIEYEVDENLHPNIMSGYVAEEVFVTNTWLTEGTYKDILDSFDYTPSVKVNISDSIQSFIPLFTGNINFIASQAHPHYWHLYIRVPKTNSIEKCRYLIYSNEIRSITKDLQSMLIDFSENPNQELISTTLDEYIKSENKIAKHNTENLDWPLYQLPYYEGLNKLGDHYWLGIYSRHEWFNIEFLINLCTLCRDSHIGQICITPWKSIIIKGITEINKLKWNQLLTYHHINIRHAANELNFQVEDNNAEALSLKHYLYHHLQADDVRTQGICFGIKTTPKTEVYSNILIKKKYLINTALIKLLPVYDILVSKDFNPNERTGFTYSQNLFKYLLPEALGQCINAHHKNKLKPTEIDDKLTIDTTLPSTIDSITKTEIIHQCPHCLTWADEDLLKIMGTDYLCSICEAPANEFKIIEMENSKLIGI